eukprot:TRINITY_DN14623_c0_g1_i1.p1 TRINITY_DN14623_c0_g1~~TRINITY_DN14623_c0_g1_i1.p1  ORF type:complete len:196 (-),score=24.42 TRINITY_DN14623_c0_g1_i1:16-603(-)
MSRAASFTLIVYIICMIKVLAVRISNPSDELLLSVGMSVSRDIHSSPFILSPSELHHQPFVWQSCGLSNDALNISLFQLDPTQLHARENVTVTFVGQLTEQMQSILVRVILNYNTGFPFGWITVVDDLIDPCDPPPPNMKCPVGPAPVLLQDTLTVPGGFKSGSYKGAIFGLYSQTAHDSNPQLPIACIEFAFDI